MAKQLFFEHATGLYKHAAVDRLVGHLITPDSGAFSFSQPAICRATQSSSELPSILPVQTRLAQFTIFWTRDRAQAFLEATVAHGSDHSRHSGSFPRLNVEGERPSNLAIDRAD